MDALIKAYGLYTEQLAIDGIEPLLSITRAWSLVRFMEQQMLAVTPCKGCGAHTVTLPYENARHFYLRSVRTAVSRRQRHGFGTAAPGCRARVHAVNPSPRSPIDMPIPITFSPFQNMYSLEPITPPGAVDVQVSDLLIATPDTTDPLVHDAMHKVLRLLRDQHRIEATFVTERSEGQRIGRAGAARTPSNFAADDADPLEMAFVVQAGNVRSNASCYLSAPVLLATAMSMAPCIPTASVWTRGCSAANSPPSH